MYEISILPSVFWLFSGDFIFLFPSGGGFDEEMEHTILE